MLVGLGGLPRGRSTPRRERGKTEWLILHYFDFCSRWNFCVSLRFDIFLNAGGRKRRKSRGRKRGNHHRYHHHPHHHLHHHPHHHHNNRRRRGRRSSFEAERFPFPIRIFFSCGNIRDISNEMLGSLSALRDTTQNISLEEAKISYMSKAGLQVIGMPNYGSGAAP